MLGRELDSDRMLNRLKQDSFPHDSTAGVSFMNESVRDFFDDLFRTLHVTRADVIRDACISRTYGYQILDGSRMGARDYYLSVAIAMKLDLRTTQRMLAVTCRGGLYPLSKRDAAVIFALNHGYDNARTWKLMTDLGLKPLETNVE